MIRKIIHIDEEKCNGCGLCAHACHENAIDMVNGKAKLVRESYCDGLGDCLPSCPTNAITFEEREAPEYDDAAVKRAQADNRKNALTMTKEQIMQIEDENERRTLMLAKLKEEGTAHSCTYGGCPGARTMQIQREQENQIEENSKKTEVISRLQNWPVQIKLAPIQAPYFDGAKLLIAADCTAYAYATMHEDFMKNKVTLIGCPKLDAVNYQEKLMQIIAQNNIKSVTIIRMEVPCCGGLEIVGKRALQESGKFIPWEVLTIGIDGTIKE